MYSLKKEIEKLVENGKDINILHAELARQETLWAFKTFFIDSKKMVEEQQKKGKKTISISNVLTNFEEVIGRINKSLQNSNNLVDKVKKKNKLIFDNFFSISQKIKTKGQ